MSRPRRQRKTLSVEERAELLAIDDDISRWQATADSARRHLHELLTRRAEIAGHRPPSRGPRFGIFGEVHRALQEASPGVLRLSEIVEVLKTRGLLKDSRNPSAAVAMVLGRYHGDFERGAGGHGWRLKKR